MARIGMCDINNLKLSKNSMRAVGDIKDTLERGTLLEGILAATPFYSIFATPSATKSPFETMITIREHDWDTFISAMSSANKFVRRNVFMIANEQELYSYGEERKFWSCVSEAAK